MFAICHRKLMHRRLGQNLRRLRDEKGITQEQLEEMTGISQGTLSGYETGRGGWTRKAVMRLAQALEVDIEELFLRPETREQMRGASLLTGLEEDDIQTLVVLAGSLRERRNQRDRSSA